MNTKKLLLLLVLAACTLHARAEEPKTGRVALVIGNNRYESAVGPLRNPVNDAKAMAKALRALGFSVIEKHNLSRDELMGALLQFRPKLRGAQVGLFYFAGHGISVAGSNYLVPLKSGYTPEAPGETERRLLAETKLFNAEQVVAEMSTAGAGCNLVILDACRSTPIAREPQARQLAPGGLVEMNPPAGSLVAFATDSGHTANDGAGIHGLYTDELIKHLLTPGLTIEQVFKRTRAGVMARSGGAQIPAEYSRLVGDDIFLLSSSPAKTAEPPKPSTPTIADAQALAATGDAAHCLEALRAHGIDPQAAAPLTTLLDQVKETLRDPKTAATRAEKALQTCDVVIAAVKDCLPPTDAHRPELLSKAQNRRGDALLLLNRPEDALPAYTTAAALAPDDGYIIYNRARALLALGKKDEARAGFTTAASAKFKHSGVRKLAAVALSELN